MIVCHGRFYFTTRLIAVLIHFIAMLPVNTTERSFTSEFSV